MDRSMAESEEWRLDVLTTVPLQWDSLPRQGGNVRIQMSVKRETHEACIFCFGLYYCLLAKVE